MAAAQTQQALIVWNSDGTSREVPLEPGIYHAGSDLGCDFYFHPDDDVPRFELEIGGPGQSIRITARRDGVTLGGNALPVGTPIDWQGGQRLEAGRIAMTLPGATGAARAAGATAQSSAAARLLFGISMAMTVGYLTLGWLEPDAGASAPATLAMPQQTISIHQASAEIRRLTEGWPNHLRPSIMVAGKQLTVRLQEQASGNIALLAQIENMRLQPDERLTILDIPYSDEQFTALGIDALAVRPRKQVMTRSGTTIGLGEGLAGSWILRDITSGEVSVSRGPLSKTIRLKAI